MNQYVVFMHSSESSLPSKLGELEKLRCGEIEDGTDQKLEKWLQSEIVCFVSSALTKGQLKISLRQASDLQTNLHYHSLPLSNNQFTVGIGLIYIKNKHLNKTREKDPVLHTDLIQLGIYSKCNPNSCTVLFSSQVDRQTGKFMIKNITKTIGPHQMHLA